MLVSEYSIAELKVLADFFEKCVAMWEEEREKLLNSERLQQEPGSRNAPA
jgi:hypothetical protein